MNFPIPSIVDLKRKKRGVMMAVDTHRLLGAVNRAGEVLKQKQGISV